MHHVMYSRFQESSMTPSQIRQGSSTIYPFTTTYSCTSPLPYHLSRKNPRTTVAYTRPNSTSNQRKSTRLRHHPTPSQLPNSIALKYRRSFNRVQRRSLLILPLPLLLSFLPALTNSTTLQTHPKTTPLLPSIHPLTLTHLTHLLYNPPPNRKES